MVKWYLKDGNSKKNIIFRVIVLLFLLNMAIHAMENG